MALNIFSFDLAALINSVANIINSPAPEVLPMTGSSAVDASLAKTTEVLKNSSEAEEIIDDLLMTAAMTNAVTPPVSPDEIFNRENQTIDNSSSDDNSAPSIDDPLVTISINPPPILSGNEDEAMRQLIRSLQTSVMHSYQSTDIIHENVSHNNVANCLKKDDLDDSENKPDNLQEEKRRNEIRLEKLREELRRAILKNNSNA
jgi:hypothetical protein